MRYAHVSVLTAIYSLLEQRLVAVFTIILHNYGKYLSVHPLKGHWYWPDRPVQYDPDNTEQQRTFLTGMSGAGWNGLP